MAISLGTVLTPYMGHGRPLVEMEGDFALGCVHSTYEDGNGQSRSCIRLATWLSLFRVISGSGMRLVVEGRHNDMRGGYGSLAGLTSSDFARTASFSWNADSPACVRMKQPVSARWGSMTEMVRGGDDSYYDVGTAVSYRVYIYVAGKVSSLDLTRLRASTLDEYNHMTVQDDNEMPAISGTPDNRKYRFRDYAPGTGFRVYDVHIYDQPWLRGHVTVPDYFTNAGKKVVWH